MDFFEIWKQFNTRFDEGDLTASTQLVGYKLLAMFDLQRFPDSLPVTDRELMNRTNINSTKTIMEARRRLKNAGLIDFVAKKNKPTRYFLLCQGNTEETPSKHEGNTEETPSKHEGNTEETPSKHEGNTGKNSYIRARASLYPYNPITPNLSSAIITTAREENFESNDNSSEFNDDFDEVQARWQFLQFAKLNFTILSQLKNLLTKYGKAAIFEAMDKANESNSNSHGVSFKFFAAILERQQNPVKGGDKFGQRDNQPAGRSSEVEPVGTAVEPDYSWLDKLIAERAT